MKFPFTIVKHVLFHLHLKLFWYLCTHLIYKKLPCRQSLSCYSNCCSFLGKSAQTNGHGAVTIFFHFFSSPEPKARVSYCHSAPSVVRPSVRPSVCPSYVRRPSVVRPSSVRKLFTFSTSSPEPLAGFWLNLVGMKYSWSLTSVVVFRPDPRRGGSRVGPK